jgi:hypothetical protein
LPKNFMIKGLKSHHKHTTSNTITQYWSAYTQNSHITWRHNQHCLRDQSLPYSEFAFCDTAHPIRQAHQSNRLQNHDGGRCRGCPTVRGDSRAQCGNHSTSC